jgi:hypothetical protein
MQHLLPQQTANPDALEIRSLGRELSLLGQHHGTANRLKPGECWLKFPASAAPIQQKVLEDMQARLEMPVNGMINRYHVGQHLFSIGTFYSNLGNTVHDLASRITKLGRDALALLEKWDLAEPADDINGRNGYMVLSPGSFSTIFGA